MDFTFIVLGAAVALYLGLGFAIAASPLVRQGIHAGLGFTYSVIPARLSARERLAYAALLCVMVAAWPILVTGVVAAVPFARKPRSLPHALGAIVADLRASLARIAMAQLNHDTNPEHDREMRGGAGAREKVRRTTKDPGCKPGP